MNNSKYRNTLYIIIVVIISTIGIQVYWNYKNFRINEQQLTRDLKTSLDKTIDDYYTELAQNTTMGIKIDNNKDEDFWKEGGVLDRITQTIDKNQTRLKGLDSIEVNSIEGISVFRGLSADSLMDSEDDKPKNKFFLSTDNPDFLKQKDSNSLRFPGKIKKDSSKLSNLEFFTSKVVISITNDTLNLKTIDSMLYKEIKQKSIDLEYNLSFKETKKSNPLRKKQIVVESDINQEIAADSTAITIASTSSLLPKNSTVTMTFKNDTWVIFQRMFGGIIISLILVLAVIACLFYLLNVIKQQKQLAEVKNDLISNITHEFKTPISTIGVALESLQNFEAIEDKNKTKNYLNMSNLQLSKLNNMVEKLLETATLDSEHLELKKSEYDISEVVRTISEKHSFNNQDKAFKFHIEPNIVADVDVFHFENAINNIIDNAFKYGGNEVQLKLRAKQKNIEVSISDNGNTLNKDSKERIFEKFYRVPKGNTHDVKGFGIGLYYTKKIIQKHGGTIQLSLKPNLTTFKIKLPND